VKGFFKFILRFTVALLALGICLALGISFSWLLGGVLFRRGIIDDATLFGFLFYGVVPVVIVGGICYAVILIGRPISK
jgi:prolipoprotein diacylglyceryltransferase